MYAVMLVILLVTVISVLILDFYRYLLKLSPWTVVMRVLEANAAFFVGYFFAGFIVSADVLRITCGAATAVAVGILAYKSCARRDVAEPEEVLKTYEALMAWEKKFLQHLENFTKSLLTQFDTPLAVWLKNVQAELKATSDHAAGIANAVNSRLNEIKNFIEETAAVLRQLTSDLAKLRMAVSEITRIRNAQYDMTEKLESLVTTIEEATLKYEGRRQSIKELYMEKVVKLLQDGGFTVQLGTGRKQPRIIAKVNDRKVFVATCKAYALTSYRKQRTVYLKQLPEAEHAKRNAVDLVIFIINTMNDRIWACLVDRERLMEGVETITTPTWLAESTDEAERKCQQSLQQLIQFYIKQKSA